MQEQNEKDCFDEFADASPRKIDATVHVLYEYEKYYMELVKKYTPAIHLLKDMLAQIREEQIVFYREQLPAITQKLREDVGIDEEACEVWLKRLIENMDHSFEMSEKLIHDYLLMDMQEFRTAIRDKLGIL